jgi:hypothetical protein
LLVQGVDDLAGEALTHPGCKFLEPASDPAPAGMAEGFGRRPGPQQIQHCRVVQARAKDALPGRAVWVSRPRILFDVAVACLARSSSKPQSIVSSASRSSAIWMERSV